MDQRDVGGSIFPRASGCTGERLLLGVTVESGSHKIHVQNYVKIIKNVDAFLHYKLHS